MKGDQGNEERYQEESRRGQNYYKKHPKHDLSLTEVEQLYALFEEAFVNNGKGLYDAIITAFDFGVSVGARATK